MGERPTRGRLPLRAPRPPVVHPPPRSPPGDRLERGRALPLRRQLRPGQGYGIGVGVVDGKAPHGVRGKPHRLPQRAVVDPARHGEAARLAGHVGAVGPVEAAAVAAALLRDQQGAAGIPGSDDDRAGRTVGQGVDRRVDATDRRLLRVDLLAARRRRAKAFSARPGAGRRHGALSSGPFLGRADLRSSCLHPLSRRWRRPRRRGWRRGSGRSRRVGAARRATCRLGHG